ncbi:hypothetical protein [Streptomyces sp. NPDC017673]
MTERRAIPVASTCAERIGDARAVIGEDLVHVSGTTGSGHRTAPAPSG